MIHFSLEFLTSWSVASAFTTQPSRSRRERRGVLYGWLFQRAANDPRGGWLFGMAYGFVLWMLGPIPLLQWAPEQPILTGYPAVGLLLGELLWGLILGLAFPFVHRPLRARLDATGPPPAHIGSRAAANPFSARDGEGAADVTRESL